MTMSISASITADSYCAACERTYDGTAATCPDDGTPLVQLPAEDESLTGRTIDDRYQVRELLGRGGMGSVYAGWQAGTEPPLFAVSANRGRSLTPAYERYLVRRFRTRWHLRGVPVRIVVRGRGKGGETPT